MHINSNTDDAGANNNQQLCSIHNNEGDDNI